MKQRISGFIILYAPCLVLCMFISAHNVNDYQAFDDLYPSTPLRSLLVTYAHMWQLYDYASQESLHSWIIIDAITGCSMRLYNESTLILTNGCGQHCIYEDDVLYLASIVEELLQMHNQLQKTIALHPSVRQNLEAIHHTLSTFTGPQPYP